MKKGADRLRAPANEFALLAREQAPDVDVRILSVGELIMTMWNLVFAVAVVRWAFGWKGGKQLVGESYTEAKQKAADQRTQRAAKKEAEKAEEAAEGEHRLRERLHCHPHEDASADEAEP